MKNRIKVLTVALISMLPLALANPPAQAAGFAWSSVSVGAFHTCAIRTTGALYCWGQNSLGAVGDGTKTFRNKPVRVGTASNWTVVATGGLSTCGIRGKGHLYCWGNNGNGQTGQGDTFAYTTPQEISGSWTQVALGTYHTCGVTGGHRLYCWGYNDSSRLGDGTQTEYRTPHRVGTLANWSTPTAGEKHSCATTTGHRLYCWGDNANGQLGDGSVDIRRVPTRIGVRTDWTGVQAGFNHSCGHRAHGRIYCWGAGNLGQVGDGGSAARMTPTEAGAAIRPWLGVSAGYQFSCGIRTNHRLYCWGRNNVGNLGDGTFTQRLSPRREALGLSDWIAVDTGQDHACAIRSNKSLYCWGRNTSGQLGIGTNDNRNSPRKVI